MRDDKPVLPLPELITRDQDPADVQARKWTFNSGGAATNLRERVMNIPVGDSPEDLATRQHEMLHVAFSPITEDGTAHDMALLAAEDARVETLAVKHGIHRQHVHYPVTEMIDAALQNSITAAASLAVASISTPDETEAREAAGGMFAPLIDSTKALFEQDISFAGGQAAAQLIRDIATSLGGTQDSESGTPGTGSGLPMHQPAPEPEDDEEDDDEEDEHNWETPEAARRRQENREELPFNWDLTIPKSPREQPWGVPSIDRPPLTRLAGTVKGKNDLETVSRKPRWRDQGTVPGAMHRMTTDQKVFRTRTRISGGTILIDMSGSMSITSDQVEELLQQAPAATVAGYWGYGDGTGTIRVLAADGRMTAKRYFESDGGTNEIDLPAIEWLARQPGPRYWVCDGAITVTGDWDPSDEQKEYFWARLGELGITWVPARAYDWVEKTLKAVRVYR